MDGDSDTQTWTRVLTSALGLLDELRGQGYGEPPFTLGGGTVLMLRFMHRLSNDVDLFSHDARWLALLSPRLNASAERLAQSFDEQANSIKIVTAHGDIDFIIAGDVIPSAQPKTLQVSGRTIPIDSAAEILAKKAYFRASGFKPRDVYDLSAAIDLDPSSAAKAVRAAALKAPILLRRLSDLGSLSHAALVAEIIPYGTSLPHAANMISKVSDFVSRHMSGPDLSETLKPTRKAPSRPKRDEGWER